jgi:hypothetical protein
VFGRVGRTCTEVGGNARIGLNVALSRFGCNPSAVEFRRPPANVNSVTLADRPQSQHRAEPTPIVAGARHSPGAARLAP